MNLFPTNFNIISPLISTISSTYFFSLLSHFSFTYTQTNKTFFLYPKPLFFLINIYKKLYTNMYANTKLYFLKQSSEKLRRYWLSNFLLHIKYSYDLLLFLLFLYPPRTLFTKLHCEFIHYYYVYTMYNFMAFAENFVYFQQLCCE